MAYLAKECLLLDPDDRPTMSEVVQILSTIAPEKSRRRNLPVNFYQVINLCHYFLGTFDFLITGFLVSLVGILLMITGPPRESPHKSSLLKLFGSPWQRPS